MNSCERCGHGLDDHDGLWGHCQNRPCDCEEFDGEVEE